MYFESRKQAGEQLAAQLKHLRSEDIKIVALNEGGVAVAEPIANTLHSGIWMLLSKPVNLPSSQTETIGAIVQDGTFVVDDSLSEGEVEEIQDEFHGFIDEEKIRQMHAINQLIGGVGVVDPSILKDHKVLAVSDGLPGVSQLDALESYLKPMTLKKLIVATPMASVEAVDKMHIMFDEIYCLNVIDNFLTVDHYYNETAAPSHEEATTIIKEIIHKWA